MELYVLLKGYVSHSIPECYIISFILCITQITEDVGLEPSAAKEHTAVNIVVCNRQIPGARFLPVSLSIGETCIPGRIIITNGGVLPVFTKYVEFLNRNIQIYAIQFSIIFIIIILELNVICAQFSNTEVISSLCKQCIIIQNISVVTSIELAKAYSCIELTIIVSNLCSIITLGIAIEPAALITEYNRLAAETYCYAVTEVVIYKQLIHRGGSSVIALEVHVAYQTALYIGRIIDLTFYVDTHTTIPAISLINSFILITHTSIAGPVNVAHFLFQVGNANAQVSQFVSVFASQFVEGCTLFSVQLVFFCHEAGNDLSQFITGNVSFAFEGAVRIALYHALVGEVGYCLVSPVIGGNIGKRIGCVSGYASGECCYSSDCENLFHSSSLL